jgi:hypothetical protein
MAADGSALFGLIERNENMETFCGWIDCYASYAGPSKNWTPASLSGLPTHKELEKAVSRLTTIYTVDSARLTVPHGH